MMFHFILILGQNGLKKLNGKRFIGETRNLTQLADTQKTT